MVGGRDTDKATGWADLKPYGNMLYADFVWGRESATFVCLVPAGHYEVVEIRYGG